MSLWLIAALPSRQSTSSGFQPPVTVLKPVCGLDPALERNLRSFCEQDYPEFQILFGVRDADDPAIPVIERLVKEYPQRHAALTVDSRVIGSNYKIANVANMMRQARHDILVIADADCRVGSQCLAELAECFADPAVGAATCLYRGAPARNRLADRLGAMFINEWFLPSVLMALRTEPLRYCFGATMAIRRNALTAIGGIETLASYLADDHMLGRLVAARGFKVALCHHIVETTVAEASLKSLFRHELRWARTMRTVRPVGYALSFVTDVVPLALLGGLLTGSTGIAVGSVGLALLLRLLMHFAARSKLGMNEPVRPWLIPFRDLLTFAIRATSLVGRGVEWRTDKFVVRTDGQMVVRNLTSGVRDENPVPQSSLF